MERELLWYDLKATILDVHDDVIYLLESYFIPVLIELELYEKADELQKGVLDQVKLGDYRSALDSVQDFVLDDSAMYKLFPWLIDKIEPALVKLDEVANELEIP